MSEHSTRLRELSCSSYARKVCDEAADEIERLRRENEVLKSGLKNLSTLFSDEHIITTDQIRAAWRDAIFATRPDEEQTEFLEARQLGIVRCECADHGLTHGESGPCVLCNGEGWVMKDETHPLLKSQGLPSPVGAGALEEDDV